MAIILAEAEHTTDLAALGWKAGQFRAEFARALAVMRDNRSFLPETDISLLGRAVGVGSQVEEAVEAYTRGLQRIEAGVGEAVVNRRSIFLGEPKQLKNATIIVREQSLLLPALETPDPVGTVQDVARAVVAALTNNLEDTKAMMATVAGVVRERTRGGMVVVPSQMAPWNIIVSWADSLDPGVQLPKVEVRLNPHPDADLVQAKIDLEIAEERRRLTRKFSWEAFEPMYQSVPVYEDFTPQTVVLTGLSAEDFSATLQEQGWLKVGVREEHRVSSQLYGVNKDAAIPLMFRRKNGGKAAPDVYLLGVEAQEEYLGRTYEIQVARTAEAVSHLEDEFRRRAKPYLRERVKEITEEIDQWDEKELTIDWEGIIGYALLAQNKKNRSEGMEFWNMRDSRCQRAAKLLKPGLYRLVAKHAPPEVAKILREYATALVNNTSFTFTPFAGEFQMKPDHVVSWQVELDDFQPTADLVVIVGKKRR